MWFKNLKYLRINRGLSQADLGERFGIKGSRIRDYELGLAEPKLLLLMDMASFFKHSVDDFLTIDLSKSATLPASAPPKLNANSRILVVSDDGQGSENIIHVPVKAQAGYLNGFEDPTYIESLTSYRLPGVRNGTYRSFEIKGDSMLPLLPGTVVVGQYIESWREIKSNHTYVLVTKEDGIVYKRVINKVKSKGQLILLSDNPVYEPYALPIEDVQEAWSYYCHLSNAGSTQRSNLDQLLNAVEELKSEVAALKRQQLH